MATVPEDTELLNYQTTVLKVSIHCEACKKKVKRVLQGLEGVYSIDINSKQNKVTVTGSTDAESLIRRLIKYGKHAELWPEKKPAASLSSSPEAASDADTNPDAPVPKTDQQLLNTEKQQQPEELNNETIPSPPTESTATAPAAVEAGARDAADELEKKGKQTKKETSSVDESALDGRLLQVMLHGSLQGSEEPLEKAVGYDLHKKKEEKSPKGPSGGGPVVGKISEGLLQKKILEGLLLEKLWRKTIVGESSGGVLIAGKSSGGLMARKSSRGGPAVRKTPEESLLRKKFRLQNSNLKHALSLGPSLK
ncbi:heavy metal-associated isoprenylated plant protein 35-like [Phalaenopsis equestris]|uniref:heavy metal-associated isoprenylated plant protein 35-like n=1 Tax=Phalaenopsis equestris TaxID=78828 RepID=UPI0009E2F79A|nr:heavy metal-associated isoprenylated plant protein 35-like [Phalaenopsis equestris]